MKKNIIFIINILLFTLLYSCVPLKKYKKLNKEIIAKEKSLIRRQADKDKLVIENIKMRDSLESLKLKIN